MKVVILAGGYGTRLSEETEVLPKPLVEIGGYPILWHIMQIYAHYGHREFIVALGYKGELIKDYFLNFHARNSDLSLNVGSGTLSYGTRRAPEWTVELIDTGVGTLTGGRLWRLKELLGNERFMLTYGDGVAHLPIDRLLAFHEGHGKKATLTAVRPPARFGSLSFEPDDVLVRDFVEKPQVGEGWINGGFFVFEPSVLSLLGGDQDSLESEFLRTLAKQKQLTAYKHDGFWQPMDTLRDKRSLDALWASGEAPWKVWSD